MNVLWVEDGDRDAISKEIGMDELLKNVKITTPKNYKEALKEISIAKTKYDFIIIDINLENFEFESEMVDKKNEEFMINGDSKFEKEAGFHLFIDLIINGYNKDRIIFLTGNTRLKSDKEEILKKAITLIEKGNPPKEKRDKIQDIISKLNEK